MPTLRRGATPLAGVPLLLALLLGSVGPVFGHHAGEAEVTVTSEAIPGSPMTVVGAHLPEGVELTLHLRAGDRDDTVATVTTDASGAFAADVPVPADFPPGPARLVALDASGTPVEYELVVGRRSEDPAAVAGGSVPPLVPVALGLALLAVVGALGLIVRGRRRPSGRD
jgi:hypothetical protein